MNEASRGTAPYPPTPHHGRATTNNDRNHDCQDGDSCTPTKHRDILLSVGFANGSSKKLHVRPLLGILERVSCFAGLAPMPIEFLRGRPLSPDELEMLRRQIEEGFDNIAEVDDEIRAIVARNWPYLLEKLPPPEDE